MFSLSPSPPLPPSVLALKINPLTAHMAEMGFPIHWCERALAETGDNIEAALNWILSNGELLSVEDSLRESIQAQSQVAAEVTAAEVARAEAAAAAVSADAEVAAAVAEAAAGGGGGAGDASEGEVGRAAEAGVGREGQRDVGDTGRERGQVRCRFNFTRGPGGRRGALAGLLRFSDVTRRKINISVRATVV